MLRDVTVKKHPELLRLKEGEEDLEQLPPETLLLKWLNWHLKSGQANCVENFSSGIKVSSGCHFYSKGFLCLHSLNASIGA